MWSSNSLNPYCDNVVKPQKICIRTMQPIVSFQLPSCTTSGGQKTVVVEKFTVSDVASIKGDVAQQFVQADATYAFYLYASGAQGYCRGDGVQRQLVSIADADIMLPTQTITYFFSSNSNVAYDMPAQDNHMALEVRYICKLPNVQLGLSSIQEDLYNNYANSKSTPNELGNAIADGQRQFVFTYVIAIHSHDSE